MAKVFVINGVRCVPETAKFSAEKIVAESIARSAERAELARTILTIKANDILKSL